MDAAAIQQQIKDIADDLRKKRSIKMSMPPTAAATLAHFEAARPFTTVGGMAARDATAAIQSHVTESIQKGGGADMDGALQEAGTALKAAFVERMGNNGGDKRFAPLTPQYAASKSSRGMGSKIGVATGSTLAALTAAKVTVVPR